VLDNQERIIKYAEKLFQNRVEKFDETQAVFLYQYCRSWNCDPFFFIMPDTSGGRF
jgi:hypothetical protein